MANGAQLVARTLNPIFIGAIERIRIIRLKDFIK